MYRRALLTLMGSFVGSLLCGSAFSTRRSNGPLEVTFFVAGVRFHAAPPDVVVGDRVMISAASYQGSRCYEVLLGRSRIGFVPRDTIRRLPDQPTMTAVVSAVNVNALPWKRFEVTVPI